MPSFQRCTAFNQNSVLKFEDLLLLLSAPMNQNNYKK